MKQDKPNINFDINFKAKYVNSIINNNNKVKKNNINRKWFSFSLKTTI